MAGSEPDCGREASQASVACCEEWETATKDRSRCVLAAVRRLRNVFSANGHPQCRKKARTVGFWSVEGKGRVEVDGAGELRDGATERGWLLVGENQEESSCWKVISAREYHDGCSKKRDL